MKTLSDWVGRKEETDDICALPLVRRVAALLDGDPSAWRNGDPLPQGWHVCLFTPRTRQSDLGPDGHAGTDSFMPPHPLPRRVLGGRRTTFHQDIPIGATLKRVNEIASITPKTGSTGKLVIITTRQSIFVEGANTPAIVEEQDSIFREEFSPDAPRPAAKAAAPAMPQPAFARELTTDPTMLFRYSAITFNTHRIHYDQPYAVGQEGYRGLMVNGGFTSLLLVDLFCKSTGRAIRTMASRNKGAVICGRPIRLCGAPRDAGCLLWLEDIQTSNVMLEAEVQ